MALATPTLFCSTAHPPENAVKSEIVRPVAQFPPSAWGHFFVDFVQDEAKLDEWTERVQVLKKEVKMILRNAEGTPYEIYLVDVVKRVGFAYQFETEIEDALYRIYNANVSDGHGSDLYYEALRFRVLREGGYKASTDVFEKFKDEQGKTFKKSLTEDIKGLLSLYEAAFLGIRGEDILDEAIAFTSEHLKSSLPNLDPLLVKQIQRALELPTHKRLPRTNARYFISFYEEIDGKTSEDMRTLLEYAKLDFNLVQAVHQREIKDVSMWWKEKGLAEKLSYARNRAVECYVWNMSVAPEPRFSRARVFGATTLSMISMTDDTYDAYGVYEELKQYTEAIERWDLAAMDELPDYVKPLYHELITYFKETEEELEREGYSYQIGYMKKAVQDLCRGYFTEAEWYHNRYTPGTEEYIRVSLITCGYPAVFLLTMVCMKEASVEAFEWWNSQPRIVMAAAEICRFIDDLVSNKFEQERGHVVSGIECFMEEKGMARQEVQDLFKHFYDTAWKDINEACLRPIPFPMYILSKAVNLARVIDGWYNSNDEDEYTFSGGRTKEMITALLVDPIPV
ncbi:viridiflorene synthase-like [Aristolochia californica]|uniref:viridiflorene synthase-like n=1 Tax=Aristolochia californica TaxID=171875 RepID=UPI0035D80C22